VQVVHFRSAEAEGAALTDVPAGQLLQVVQPAAFEVALKVPLGHPAHCRSAVADGAPVT